MKKKRRVRGGAGPLGLSLLAAGSLLFGQFAVSLADSGRRRNGSGSNSGAQTFQAPAPGGGARRDDFPRPEPLGRGPEEDGGVPPVHAGQRCACAARSQQDRPEQSAQAAQPGRPGEDPKGLGGVPKQAALSSCRTWSATVGQCGPPPGAPPAQGQQQGLVAEGLELLTTTRLVQAKHGADPPAHKISPARGPSGGRASFGLCVEDREGRPPSGVLELSPPRRAAEIGHPLFVGLELTRVATCLELDAVRRELIDLATQKKSRGGRGSRRTCRRCRGEGYTRNDPRSRTSLHRRHVPRLADRPSFPS